MARNSGQRRDRPRLSQRLRELRTRADIRSQQELADLSGLSVGTVGNYERGYNESGVQIQFQPESLQLLAEGLSKNRRTKEVNVDQKNAIYRELAELANLAPQDWMSQLRQEFPDIRVSTDQVQENWGVVTQEHVEQLRKAFAWVAADLAEKRRRG